MDDADVTDRVLVIVHQSGAERDDEPTAPVVVGEDNTTRLRSEFEEDTVEEYLWHATG